MAESKEEIKSLLMKVKEENEKAGLKLNIQKPKIKASGPLTSQQIDGQTTLNSVHWQAVSLPLLPPGKPNINKWKHAICDFY